MTMIVRLSRRLEGVRIFISGQGWGKEEDKQKKESALINFSLSFICK